MTVRWGIIGTGDVAEKKGGPALYSADRSELVGVTSRTLSRAQSFADRHGHPRVYPSVDQLLGDDSIRAVYIATPPDSHAQLTERAASAGKHVLCEKPMARNVSECNQMIDACRRHSVSLTIAYYRRYFPVVQKIKWLVENQAIGRPLRISAATMSAFQGGLDDPWRLDPAIAGGGFLMDMGTHRFDLFAYLFGPAISATGIVTTQSLKTSVEDAASVAIQFENGAQGSAAFQWNCPVERDSLEVAGTEGIVWTDTLSSDGRLILETSGGRECWRLPAPSPVHLKLVEQTVNHLLDGQPNPCPGESGIQATRIVHAIYETAASHL